MIGIYIVIILILFFFPVLFLFLGRRRQNTILKVLGYTGVVFTVFCLIILGWLVYAVDHHEAPENAVATETVIEEEE